MKERPILFSGAMVQAILSGRKTQTRRLVKKNDLESIYWLAGQDNDWLKNYGRVPDASDLIQKIEKDEFRVWTGDCPEEGYIPLNCQHGKIGDRLWVKETTIISPPNWLSVEDQLNTSLKDLKKDNNGEKRVVQYLATNPDTDVPINDYKLKKTPSIFMPRWASRILLEITSLRVERLNEISNEDAQAEGLKALTKDNGQTIKYGIPDFDGLPGNDDCGWNWYQWNQNPTEAFKTLWESINGENSWQVNPWVWVIEFKVIQDGGV